MSEKDAKHQAGALGGQRRLSEILSCLASHSQGNSNNISPPESVRLYNLLLASSPNASVEDMSHFLYGAYFQPRGLHSSAERSEVKLASSQVGGANRLMSLNARDKALFRRRHRHYHHRCHRASSSFSGIVNNWCFHSIWKSCNFFFKLKIKLNLCDLSLFMSDITRWRHTQCTACSPSIL